MWTPRQPFAIHVNDDPGADVAAATAAGALVRTLELGGLKDFDQLYQRTTEVFEIPFAMGGSPGMVDWLAGPDWLPIDHGALWIFDAATAQTKIVDHVAQMLPPIAERWRTGGTSFLAFLIHVDDLETVQTTLAKANAELDEFAKHPWSINATGSVPVIYG